MKKVGDYTLIDVIGAFFIVRFVVRLLDGTWKTIVFLAREGLWIPFAVLLFFVIVFGLGIIIWLTYCEEKEKRK